PTAGAPALAARPRVTAPVVVHVPATEGSVQAAAARAMAGGRAVRGPGRPAGRLKIDPEQADTPIVALQTRTASRGEGRARATGRERHRAKPLGLAARHR